MKNPAPVLSLPVVIFDPAPLPAMVSRLPVVSDWSADCPRPTLSVDTLVKLPAPAPRKMFSYPAEPKACIQGPMPMKMTPLTADELVMGRTMFAVNTVSFTRSLP